MLRRTVDRLSSGRLEETPHVITRGFVVDARTDRCEGDPSPAGRTVEGAEYEDADGSGAHQVEGFEWILQRFFRQAIRGSGRSAAGGAWRLMADLPLARLSEFVGVVLFACALMWVDLAGDYSPNDRSVLHDRRPRLTPSNFGCGVARSGELSFSRSATRRTDSDGLRRQRLALLLVCRVPDAA